MAKVLYIKANPRSGKQSRTFRISDEFIEAYSQSHPQDEIITLDLHAEGIDFLRQNELDIFYSPADGISREHPILKYAWQFVEADKYVIAEPFWNLSFPAILKAYIDYVTVMGITFKYTETGSVGLCTGKKAVNITSRGGIYSSAPESEYEMADRYLRALFGFLGITDFTTIVAEGLDIQGNDVDAIVDQAIAKAKEAAKAF